MDEQGEEPAGAEASGSDAEEAADSTEVEAALGAMPGAETTAGGEPGHGSAPSEHEASGTGHGEEPEEGEAEEEEDEENLPLRHALRERLIQFEGMDPGVKLLIGVGLAQLVVAALLLAVRQVSLPSIVGDQTSAADFSDIPDIAFGVAIFGFCAAWSFLLAGAYRGGWVIRALFIAAFGWGFWEVRDVISGEPSYITILCAAFCLLVIAIGVVTYFPERQVRLAIAEGKELGISKSLHRMRLATPGVLFLLIGGTAFVAFIGALQYDHSHGIQHHTDIGSAVVFFTTSFSYLLYNHQYVLIPVLVLAGSEFGAWSDFAAGRIGRRFRTAPRQWILPAVTLLVAAAILVDSLRTAANPDYGGGIGPELVLGGVLIAILVLVFLVAKPSGGVWAPSIPFLAVAFVAIVDTVVGFIVEQRLNAADPLLDEKVYGVSVLLWLIGALVCLVVMAAMRGRLSAAWVNTGIFIVLVGATETLQALPYLGAVVHPFGLSTQASITDGEITPFTDGWFMGVEGIRAVVAIVTIALVAYALAMRKLEHYKTPIITLLVLLGALQFLTWFDLLFGRTTDVTGNFAIAAGVVLVIAITWEFLSSGEAVTNQHTSRFTRSTRVYVYLGYVLLVAISVLYYSDLSVHGTHNLIESEFDSEEWVREGILFLGVPLAIGMAMTRLQRWFVEAKAESDVVEPATQAEPGPPELLPHGVG